MTSTFSSPTIKKVLMSFFLCFSTMILLISISGCSTSKMTLDDIVFAEIYYNDDSDTQETTEKTFVSSTRDPELLKVYFDALVLGIPDGDDLEISSDLNYTLNLRTSKDLLTYSLSFDLSKKQGIASNDKGTYKIPFEWVNGYLSDLHLDHEFSHLDAPSFELFYGEKQINTSIKKQWSIHPTTDVSYISTLDIKGTDTLPIDNNDLLLNGHFSANGPTIVNISLTNISDDVTSALVFYFTSKGTTLEMPLPDSPGSYLYTIDCEWNTPEDGYEGIISYNFQVNYAKPMAFHLNESNYLPGDTIAVVIENATSLDYRVETAPFSKTVGLFYLGNSENDSDDNDLSTPPASKKTPRTLVGLVPLSSWTTPGNYTIDFYVDSTGEKLASIPYTIGSMDFPRQDLTVSTTTAALKSNDNSEKDRIKFQPARAYSVGEKLWEGTFIEPIDGRITTEYATDRYVNGESVASSRHNAIDLAAPLGTPIKAANNGIVTFASDLIISGNVVVIDHGYGLFSSYVHMNKIDVEVGDVLKKGDIIGEVGTTGYSTGPHLHWSIWKNGVYLNPWTFVYDDPLSDFK